jgi:hypothetical protein
LEELALGGRRWRRAFGGSHRALDFIVCNMIVFCVFRLLLLLGSVFLLWQELTTKPLDTDWLLVFEHWVLMLQCAYFALAMCATLAASCSPEGLRASAARSTPTVVRITELFYGALVPAAWVAFLVAFLVHWARADDCVSNIARNVSRYPVTDAMVTGAGLGIVLIDAAVNGQSYYASVHALWGALFCWAWLAFSVVWEAMGGFDRYGHSYIYRCLDWSYPIAGGGRNAQGKLTILNIFVFIPCANYLFWLLLWARRRATPPPEARGMTTQMEGGGGGGGGPPPSGTPGAPRSPALGLASTSFSSSTTFTAAAAAAAAAASSSSASSAAASPLLGRSAPQQPAARWANFFQYAADLRDLSLDGKHWRAQFGRPHHPSEASAQPPPLSSRCHRHRAAAVTTTVFPYHHDHAQACPLPRPPP